MSTTSSLSIQQEFSDWAETGTRQPGDVSKWLEWWNLLNERPIGDRLERETTFEEMVCESLLERILIQFLELNGVKLERLPRLGYIFANLIQKRFRASRLAALLASEVNDLLTNDTVKPNTLEVEGDYFLAVDPSFAIVTSGRVRRYFPTVNEPLSVPGRGKDMLELLSEKVKEAIERSKKRNREITRLCFIEKSFGPAGFISLASDLVQRVGIPAVTYRAYGWNNRQTRLSSGEPREGENLCAVYDVAISGSVLVHANDYFNRHYRSGIAAVVVNYDLEEGAEKRLKDIVFIPVRKKSQFMGGLEAAYYKLFGEPMTEPEVTGLPDRAFVAKVLEAAEQSLDDEENMIVSALEQFVREHEHDRVMKGRLAIGNRLLTWDDVIREMRQRTPFGVSYLRALAQTMIPHAIGKNSSLSL